MIFAAIGPGSHGFAGFLLKEEKFGDLVDSFSGISLGVLIVHDGKVMLRSTDAIIRKVIEGRGECIRFEGFDNAKGLSGCQKVEELVIFSSVFGELGFVDLQFL